MPFWKAGRREGRPTRIFLASDIHGSDATYAKFLAAAERYDVDCLVFGGDLMGKALVPIVEGEDGRWIAYTNDGTHELANRPAVDDFVKDLSSLGLYWWQGSRTEYEQFMNDQYSVEKEFEKAAADRLERWIELARKKFSGSNRRVFLCGGNDDTDALVNLLDQLDSPEVINCDNRVVPVDDKHQMLTLGWSTPTPWSTPREKSEEAIEAELIRLVAEVADPASLILNVHVPPIDSGLDTCMKLDASTWPPSPIIKGGQPVYFGAGSKAVDTFIRMHQPVVGLHGHIHESKGLARINSTPCFNAGSEYSEGVLRGVIVSIRDNKVEGYQFTSG